VFVSFIAFTSIQITLLATVFEMCLEDRLFVSSQPDSQCRYLSSVRENKVELKPHTWWRFIHDIFIIWMEGEEKLREFLDYLNDAHDTVKSTFK